MSTISRNRSTPFGASWGLLLASGSGVLQGIVAAASAALCIWLALTMTGFSPTALAVVVVFGCYAVIVGLLFSPLVGSAILRLMRKEGNGASHGIAGEAG